jgi:hypothetical protein
MAEAEGVVTHARSRNHWLWLGPLIAIPGFISYWGFFVRWPVFRDTAWLNIAILLGAVAISVVGLRRAWPRGGWLRRSAGVAGLALSAALTGLLVVYCYVLSYDLPSAEHAIAEGERLPAITLASYDGEPVDLAATGEGSTVLVFYRGFW